MNPATSKQIHNSPNSKNFALYASALVPLLFTQQTLGNVGLNQTDP